MSANNRVNQQDPFAQDASDAAIPERERWWLRKPAVGVLAAAVLGVATATVTLSIRTPDSTPGATLLYLVILPIALLLPAIAIGGAFIAWRAFAATSGTMRLLLAAPATLAVVLNIAAVAVFLRWLVQVFIR